MTQKEMFYQSHCMVSSGIHLKMAELQRKAGNEVLARDSEKTALARRISGRNMTHNIGESLSFGEYAVTINI
jgi:hypothetical protein